MERFVSLSSGDQQQCVTPSNEEVPLLQKTLSNQLRQRYRNTRKCVTSKEALLLLVCSLPVTLLYLLLINPNTIEYIHALSNFKYFPIASSGYRAVVYCFYPLAGYLADNKFGLYKTVVTSLWMLPLALILASVGFVVTAIAVMMRENSSIFIVVMICAGGIIALVGLILMMASFVAYNANVIQFGLNQLHDSPGEDQSLFIHWYTWTYYVALFTVNAILSTMNQHSPILFLSLLGSISVLVFILLIVTVCVAHHRRRWFLIDPSRLNPYKLVYHVFKFACQHKVPVHRSAFTYCEDELPSGLDLGKNKYGGPFTTEQVEDVKAFYGVLKVLFSLGLVFFLHVAADPALSLYSFHVSNYTYSRGDIYSNATHNNALQIMEQLFLEGEVLYPLLVVVCIPLYLFLLRPFILYYIPSMLRRIGIGITVMVISLIYTFLIETMTHVKSEHLGCMFKNTGYYNESYNNLIMFRMDHSADRYENYLLVAQSIVLALSNMLIYIALYEFVCSQSPHSMKGLLIGLSFAIRGVFEAFASAVVIPFALGWHINSFPSCGMYYYLVNIVVGLVAMSVFTYTARGYKYRERDEPCNVYRYVEEYYTNLQQQRANSQQQ